MTYPVGSAPDGAYVVGSKYGSDITEASAKAIMTGKTKTAFGNAQDQHKINVGNPLTSLFGSVGQLFDRNDEVSNEIIEINAAQVAANERLEDLEDITGTGVTTPVWSSAGGKDLVSFPRALMQPYLDVNHRHSYDPDSTQALPFTGTSNIGMAAPAFVQTHGIVDMAFIRGGVDRAVQPKVVKVVTGADASLFDVTAWYLGLYVYNPTTTTMVKVWDSGNLAGVLSSQRQAYNIGTGLTNTFIQQDHLCAVASLQIASGGARRPRGLGCIFQTGISEAAGTIPPAPHAYVNVTQTTLPSGVAMNGGYFTWVKDKIMWAAVGESS
jgi:hypothetical protein